MLRSDLCDYSDGYIFVQGTVIVEEANDVNKMINKNLVFKNNASFRSCILKINNTLIDIAEDLDVILLSQYIC